MRRKNRRGPARRGHKGGGSQRVTQAGAEAKKSRSPRTRRNPSRLSIYGSCSFRFHGGYTQRALCDTRLPDRQLVLVLREEEEVDFRHMPVYVASPRRAVLNHNARYSSNTSDTWHP